MNFLVIVQLLSLKNRKHLILDTSAIPGGQIRGGSWFVGVGIEAQMCLWL